MNNFQGNFQNYYGMRFNKAQLDPRIKHLKPQDFHNLKILDIGCNAGKLALDIALFFKPSYIEGIDLDPALIRKAKLNLYSIASLLKNNSLYYPPSCLGHFGLRKFPHQKSTRFPYNINFRLSDFISEPLNPENKFDVVMALSITKWIQIQYGDSGIKTLFMKIYQILNHNGILIIEPQENTSYPINNSFSINPEDFTEILSSLGFIKEAEISVDELVKNDFKRKIYTFKKVK